MIGNLYLKLQLHSVYWRPDELIPFLNHLFGCPDSQFLPTTGTKEDMSNDFEQLALKIISCWHFGPHASLKLYYVSLKLSSQLLGQIDTNYQGWGDKKDGRLPND